ncbi:MAG: hypothetical protein HY561_06005 [Gemmatimonadetes bacterium]|nr:hypothetical protein [Gemmatimonadota bacterium]
MAHEPAAMEVPVRRLEEAPDRARLLASTLVGIGVVALVAAFLTSPTRAWRAYLFNWLYWTSLAQGAVMVAAVASITRGLWSRPVRRIALSFVAFLPISYLALLPLLLFGGEHVFPWIEAPVAGKEAWLNLPFLVARNLVALGFMYFLSLRFAYWALRPDLGLTRDQAPPQLRGLYQRFTANWRGQDAEEARSFRKLARLAPAMALVYAASFSLLAWDLVMSLEPHWWSTLIGPYFFMAAFLGGLAALAVATILYRRPLGLDGIVQPSTFHDVGKLTFGFCAFWAYLLWSQYLVIWYGLLPHEQEFVIHRLELPFAPVAVAVFLCMFVIPFFGLLGVQPKKRPALLGTFASVVLVGLWLERYVLVYPSYTFSRNEGLPFGLPEVGMALLFGGLFIFALLFFAVRFPMIQLWQPPSELELLAGAAEPPGEVVTAE